MGYRAGSSQYAGPAPLRNLAETKGENKSAASTAASCIRIFAVCCWDDEEVRCFCQRMGVIWCSRQHVTALIVMLKMYHVCLKRMVPANADTRHNTCNHCCAARVSNQAPKQEHAAVRMCSEIVLTNRLPTHGKPTAAARNCSNGRRMRPGKCLMERLADD